MLSSGIVLKVIHHKNNFLLLDEYKGKIICKKNKTEKINLVNGLHLSYKIEEQPNIFCIEKININNNPFNIAKENLVFFHHILELTDFFTPLESTSNEIYNLLNYFFDNNLKLTNKKLQKIFLGKFFFLIGIYPETQSFSPGFFKLISLPIDILLDLEIDLSIEKKLDFWINYSVESHHNYKKINTMRFVKR